jgi:PEP-CTERM motif-containing protein
MRTNVWSAAFAAIMVQVGVAVASATPIQVASRAALGGNDFVDWSALGPQGTAVADPVAVASNGATRTVTANNPNGPLQRIDEFPAGGWNGSFASGDALLWTFGSAGPIELTFSSPVFGAGAQINWDFQNIPFTAQLRVFDTSNNLLGTFTAAGITATTHDNSAVFLGVSDTVAEIARLEYSLVGVSDFAINRLAFNTIGPAAPPSSEVPEPASIVLFVSGAIGAALRRRRR